VSLLEKCAIHLCYERQAKNPSICKYNFSYRNQTTLVKMFFSFFFEKCQRLGKKSDSVIEHTNRLWDTVSLKSNFDLLLTGIGVFSPSTGGGEVIISVDARPLQDPLQPLDLVTCLDSIDDDEHTMTIFSKVSQIYSISLLVFKL
jgi:hypothetical protein